MPSTITPLRTPPDVDDHAIIIHEQTSSPQSVHEFNPNEFETHSAVKSTDAVVRSGAVSDEADVPSSPSADVHSNAMTTATTATTPRTILGPERTVTFHTESLGIKLSRHTDGRVRILSVAPFRSRTDERIRDGELHEGDLLLSVGDDIDLRRRRIDSHVWKLIMGYMKLAPRPLTMVVAAEYTEVEDANDATETMDECSGDVRRVCRRCEVTGQSVLPDDSSPGGGGGVGSFETRHVVFYRQSLGVKMQHTSRGYVVIHSINHQEDETNTANDGPSRSGELNEGDVVLQVGGVWDLNQPISVNAWGILVKFIRECRRPMRMVVADGRYLNCIMSPDGSTYSQYSSGSEGEEEEEEDSVQSSCRVSPCSEDGIRLNRIVEEISRCGEDDDDTETTVDVDTVDESSTDDGTIHDKQA